jgi:hypothetical protein
MLDMWNNEGKYFNDILDPRLLEAQTMSTESKYNEENPSFDRATRGPFQVEFWQAMRTELHTLTNEFDC